MPELTNEVFYICHVKYYDNGHAHAATNFGGGRVSFSSNTPEEAIRKSIAGALSARFDITETDELA